MLVGDVDAYVDARHVQRADKDKGATAEKETLKRKTPASPASSPVLPSPASVGAAAVATAICCDGQENIVVEEKHAKLLENVVVSHCAEATATAAVKCPPVVREGEGNGAALVKEEQQVLALGPLEQQQAGGPTQSVKKVKRGASVDSAGDVNVKDTSRQVNRFSPDEIAILESRFFEHPTPTPEQRQEIAEELNKMRLQFEQGQAFHKPTSTLTQVQIKYWFDHQRRKVRKTRPKSILSAVVGGSERKILPRNWSANPESLLFQANRDAVASCIASSVPIPAVSNSGPARAPVPTQQVPQMDMQSYLQYWQALSWMTNQPDWASSCPFKVCSLQSNEILLKRGQHLSQQLFILHGMLKISAYASRDDPDEAPIFTAVLSDGSFFTKSNFAAAASSASEIAVQAHTQCHIALIENTTSNK
mmetsp:Transcript_2813/g.6792  ORF Transcript_2813/g.6792 Transcript_2813/m.6792 type:complete len:420 (+) Transcript_2813:256-1515(+)